MEIRASQNLSSSACNDIVFIKLDTKQLKKKIIQGLSFLEDHTLLSLSVGSIISVPGTGHDIVGPWNP